MDAPLRTATLETPLGILCLEASEEGLTAIRWPGEDPSERGEGDAPRAPAPRGEHTVLARASEQLEEYFRGEREAFDLPLAAEGTAFQLRVWERLAQIPHGATTTYGALASALGDVNLARAVGAAGGRNPLPIVVPCHRVIGANGQLTGFAGGLDAKRWLLDHEDALGLAPAASDARLPFPEAAGPSESSGAEPQG